MPAEQLEFKIKKTLNNSTTKYILDLCGENYKTLMIEIRDLNKWRNIPCSLIRGHNMVKMLIFFILTCSFNIILIIILANYSIDANKF
jgi:hypothetical protein